MLLLNFDGFITAAYISDRATSWHFAGVGPQCGLLFKLHVRGVDCFPGFRAAKAGRGTWHSSVKLGCSIVLLAMDSPVVRSWMANSVILNRASAGTLCIVPRDYLSRTDVVLNGEILSAVIKFHGLRPSINSIRAEVAHFFHVGRPLGKPAVKRFSFA